MRHEKAQKVDDDVDSYKKPIHIPWLTLASKEKIEKDEEREPTNNSGGLVSTTSVEMTL